MNTDYERYHRDPFSHDVQLVDHVSYCMSYPLEQCWYSWRAKHIPATNSYLKKPHVTLMYSYDEIAGFPEIDYEDEVFVQLASIDHLVIHPESFLGYKVHTDPYGVKYLVLLMDPTLVMDQHEYLKSCGGVWSPLLGDYIPFIIIEAHTEYTDILASQLPVPGYTVIFDQIRYCHFGEKHMRLDP